MYWKGDAPRDGFHYVDQWGPEHEADMAIRYLGNEGGQYRDPNKPFAMVVSMNPPHVPYSAHPARYLEPYKDMDINALCSRPDIPPAGTPWGDYYRQHIRDYYAAITGVDEQFGRILDTIDQQGLRENTLVIFTSDHGDCVGIHKRNSKSVWWEASMNVPWIARFPGRLRPGVDDLLINAPDLHPTLLGLLELGDKVGPDVMGSNYSNLLRGEPGDRPTSQLYQWLTSKNPAIGARGVRCHQWKLVIPATAMTPDDVLFSDLAEHAKRIHLYDRQADPYELNNLADKKPQIARQLIETELIPWLVRAEDPFNPWH